MKKGREKMFDSVIIGAGVAGCVAARELAEAGKKVLVLEQRDHIGGNCYDEKDEHGILIHKYGPHIFHTHDDTIWDYVNRVARFLPYDGGFGEKHQGVPVNGYNELIEGLLKDIPTATGVSYQKLMNTFPDIADNVIYTGAIGGFFEYKFGHLDYKSRRYELEELEQEDFQGQAIVELLDDPEQCARIIEYKHFTGANSPKTIIAREYLEEWIQEKNLSKADVVRRSNLNRAYVYQIFLGRKNLLINRLISFNVGILGKIAYRSIFCQNYFPAISLQLSHDNPKQGGLPCSINSYNSRFLIFFNMKRRLLYDFIDAKGFADILAG